MIVNDVHNNKSGKPILLIYANFQIQFLDQNKLRMRFAADVGRYF